ncbi:MAG: hypothetical protein QM640_17380 [Niabella sp.]
MQDHNIRDISIFGDRNTAFNSLAAVNDCTLAPGACMEYELHAGTVLLPIVGTLVVLYDQEEIVIDCSELLVFNKATHLKVYNYYDDALINYMIITFKTHFEPGFGVLKYSFDLDNNRNEMLDVLGNGNMRISLGKFEMRRETQHYLLNESNSSFCVVIQGSFEIEGRLLHERDALAVWNTETLDIESLGKESILLLIEQELKDA